MKRKRHEYIDTTWSVYTYDVWGNARDGFEVNDRFHDGEVTLRLRVETANPDTPIAFKHAAPSDKQLREALSLRRIAIDTDGDDTVIYVNAAKNGYPCGELHCTSHESLSPVRSKTNETEVTSNEEHDGNS